MHVRLSIGAALLLLLTLLGPACGGGEEGSNEMPTVTVAGGRGGGARAARPAARAAEAEAEAESTGTGVVTQIQFPETARDPFQREFPEGEEPLLADQGIDLQPVEEADLGPLAEYPLESLRLQAIITRTPEPRAMFLVPDGSGLAVLARVDDRVGPNGTGRIVDIQPNQVVVSYEGLFEFGEDGEQVRTHVVTLRDPSRDIEAEFEPY